VNEINESYMYFSITNINIPKKDNNKLDYDKIRFTLKKNVKKQIENKLEGLLEEIRELDRQKREQESKSK
jgi:hypothetical protein